MDVFECKSCSARYTEPKPEGCIVPFVTGKKDIEYTCGGPVEKVKETLYEAINNALAQGISIELKFNPFCESPPQLLCVIAYTVVKVTNKQSTWSALLLMDEPPTEDSLAWAINDVAKELRWHRESDAIREWAGLFHIPMRPGETLENLRTWRYQDLQIKVCCTIANMFRSLANSGQSPKGMELPPNG